MKRLIVNADDLGMAESVDIGIIKGHREGIVSSASFISCGESAEHAAALAADNPGLGVGVHLCLTRLKPVSEPARLGSITKDGAFLDGPFSLMSRIFFGLVDKREVMAELRAQVERAIGLGIKPTHIDGHQHMHIMPGIFHMVAEIAGEFGIRSVRLPVGPRTSGAGFGPAVEKLFLEALAKSQLEYLRAMKLRHPDKFFGLAQTGSLDAATLMSILEKLPEGTSEIMCHPGLRDDDAARRLGWGTGWETELSAVTDPGLVKLLEDSCIQLISYKHL